MGRSVSQILAVLGDHKPKSARDIVEAAKLSRSAGYSVLYRCWKKGIILRTEEPIYEHERIFKGRGGVSQNTRPYHLYLLAPDDVDSLVVDGRRFVKYAREYLDVRGGGKKSKAQRILEYLEEHKNKAFFSKDIAEALKGYGVKARDIMSSVRRFEKKRQVYVRGYKTDDRQTPFKKGYLITWLDQEKPRKEAIKYRKNRQSLERKARWKPLNGTGAQDQRRNNRAHAAE